MNRGRSIHLGTEERWPSLLHFARDCSTLSVESKRLGSKEARLRREVTIFAAFCMGLFNTQWESERLGTTGRNKASFAERYIYIVKRKLYMLLRSQLSENWVKFIKVVVESFNNTPIKKLGYIKPNEIKSERDSVRIDLKKSSNSSSLPSFTVQQSNQKLYDENKNLLQPGDYCYKFYDEKLFDKKYNISVRMINLL